MNPCSNRLLTNIGRICPSRSVHVVIVLALQTSFLQLHDFTFDTVFHINYPPNFLALQCFIHSGQYTGWCYVQRQPGGAQCNVRWLVVVHPVRGAGSRRCDEVFESCDVLLALCCPGPCFSNQELNLREWSEEWPEIYLFWCTIWLMTVDSVTVGPCLSEPVGQRGAWMNEKFG